MPKEFPHLVATPWLATGGVILEASGVDPMLGEKLERRRREGRGGEGETGGGGTGGMKRARVPDELEGGRGRRENLRRAGKGQNLPLSRFSGPQHTLLLRIEAGLCNVYGKGGLVPLGRVTGNLLF